MNPEKDTLILSTVWDIKRKQDCQFKECPKYGWLNFILGFESEEKPMVNYRLCPTHLAEVTREWTENRLPDLFETFKKVDRKEHGLE